MCDFGALLKNLSGHRQTERRTENRPLVGPNESIYNTIKLHFQRELEDGIEYQIHLENLKYLIKRYLCNNFHDDEFIYGAVIYALKQKSLQSNGSLTRWVSKFPVQVRTTFIQTLTDVVEHLPKDLFVDTAPVLRHPINVHNVQPEPPHPWFLLPFRHQLDEARAPDPGPSTVRNLSSYLLASTSRASTGAISKRLLLYEQYEKYKVNLPSFATYMEFKKEIQQALDSDVTDNELTNIFLDTMGCEVFELIALIMKYRHGQIDYSAPYDHADLKLSIPKRYPCRETAAMGSQITVQSEEEKNLAKKIRKLEKKNPTKYARELESTEQSFNDASIKPLFARHSVVKEVYPHVHDQTCTKAATIHQGCSINLPENAIQKKTPLYNEIILPKQIIDSFVDNFELVKVKDLDITGQLVFKDIKKFNRIQSEVFPVAYHSNQNILICAPTGAGKTNIALLAMVNQIKSHMKNNVVHNPKFKIVYVSPMKALATEMVYNFSKKLQPIGVVVKELTGEMQLSKKQIAETNVIVSTPEKLDVITRKGAVDTEIISQLKLLIIDEVHLLNGTRGPVIESLVARILRYVVSAQSMIRIVALSATLPGYLDVAEFLKVNPKTGLFFFDNRFRSVPLTHTYIGLNPIDNSHDIINRVCYEKLLPFIRDGQQVMVFVTARNQTISTANEFVRQAKELGHIELFSSKRSAKNFKSSFDSSFLHELVNQGFGTHHAGMTRSDRLQIESLFRDGLLKVIVCTATLAWGVNLPAHAVIIRGTDLYDPKQSKFVDLDVLDILQIFGRAGRPQYDTSGHAVLLTSSAKMPYYMNMLMSQAPIESQFLERLADNLNGEIVLGTITTVAEAMEWLNSTYLFRRLPKNPLNYGLTFAEVWDDKILNFLELQIEKAAQTLEKAEMIRFDPKSGELRPTSYGRIASFLYITHNTVTTFLEKIKRYMGDDEILYLISCADEFMQVQVRNNELDELERLRDEYTEMHVNSGVAQTQMKVLILIQTSVSKGYIASSSLASDSVYIMQNVTRLAMALHQIALERNFGELASRTLKMTQVLEQRTWHFEHPLAQFKELTSKGVSSVQAISHIPIEELRDMTAKEITGMVGNSTMANRVITYAKAFPKVEIDLVVKPITPGVLNIKVFVTPTFKWDVSIHEGAQQYLVMVEDSMHDSIYHSEHFVITYGTWLKKEPIELGFTVPLLEPRSPEYFVKVANVHYLHAETQQVIDCEKINVVSRQVVQTKFLNVRPLPKQALHNKHYENLYNFTHFNAVQSQVFFCCYNMDSNILLGAPTGSGKTIVSELCILRVFNNNPHLKVVYIAPMKALVRERFKDWVPKFQKIDKRVVEITGDVSPKSDLVSKSNIIITTPEKWDAMSRNWQQKEFVKNVGLIIIDEIHLLGEERGPVLEVIVSRMNYINTFHKGNVRIVGLSTAMANAQDLADWLDVDKGLFNFSSAVRPVPLEIHIQGFPGRHYCPRMATMNKPAYNAIRQYAPESPVLIFVSSRKQTRITSHELVKLLYVDVDQRQWLHCSDEEITQYRNMVNDKDLSYLLQFGIAIHHAGLQEKDRDIVEKLFVGQKIQILIATATLAWGVNFPAHLVIVKGTEYFDGATKSYVDMPVTDVLQMLGRAGRPQYDTSGVACVFVEESKKVFYRKFLFEPFPVESNLLKVLPDHVNAEISNGTITCRQDLISFISTTFFYRRVIVNPKYYQMECSDVLTYCNDLSDSVIEKLCATTCITTETNDSNKVFYKSTFLGDLAARYYLSCETVQYLDGSIKQHSSISGLLLSICFVKEYALFPVRHNEDKINMKLMNELSIRLPPDARNDSPHIKVYLLIYCYINNIPLPNPEYVIDLKTVFDQIIRILEAGIQLISSKGWSDCTTKMINILQMIVQGACVNGSILQMLPYFNSKTIRSFTNALHKFFQCSDVNLSSIKALCSTSGDRIIELLSGIFFDVSKAKHVCKILEKLPEVELKLIVKNLENNDSIIKFSYDVDFDQKAVLLHTKPNTTFTLRLDINRVGGDLNAYTKSFSKQKDESWFLIVSQESEIISFDRLIIKNKKFRDIQLVSPSTGNKVYVITLLCDCYIGLDQCIEIKLFV